MSTHAKMPEHDGPVCSHYEKGPRNACSEPRTTNLDRVGCRSCNALLRKFPGLANAIRASRQPELPLGAQS